MHQEKTNTSLDQGGSTSIAYLAVLPVGRVVNSAIEHEMRSPYGREL